MATVSDAHFEAVRTRFGEAVLIDPVGSSSPGSMALNVDRVPAPGETLPLQSLA